MRIPLISLCLALAWPQAASAAPAETVSAELRAEASGGIKKFYAGRGYRPLWTESGTIGPATDRLIGYLQTAQFDGLSPSSYDIEQLREVVASARAGDAAALARAELALSRAFARYVADMRQPEKVGMTYLDKRLKPKKPKPEAVLRAAAGPKSFRDYIAAMGWMSPHYVEQRGLMARAERSGSSREAMQRIRLNLERARILPSAWTHHIVVDSASGRLWYYQAGKEKGEMRVVVGKAETPTPMMAGMLNYAILNPYWNVPVDLAQTLVAPKVLAGRSLKSLNMEALSDWSTTPARLDPTTIDWNAVASGQQELRIRELPGRANSMGRVKFMFPNDDGIYLHDTPERDLLKKQDRHFSNGCIRLEDAAGLGRWLLGRPIRTPTKVEQAVPLTVPVPVYLTYFTTAATKQGIAFREDVYGLDGRALR